MGPDPKLELRATPASLPTTSLPVAGLPVAEALPAAGALAVIPPTPNLPAVIDTPDPPPQQRRWLKPLIALAALLLVAGGTGYWWLNRLPGLPPGFASGNGRLEADEIDIDTKFAGKIATLEVDEGSVVEASQTVALMDSQDLEATLAKSQALVLQARQTVRSSLATLAQQQTEVVFARKELDRASALLQTGFETREMVDQRQQTLSGAVDAVRSDVAQTAAAARALDAAAQDVALDRVDIAYDTLVAPRAGTIEYRIANIGEVLPAGGKVFTMLDRTYVYMDVYLPTASAGRTRIGSEARILLDAYPGHPIPASVSFVAAQAQFTPKTVETRTERDSLMFRVRVRIDPARLALRTTPVKSGLPGEAIIRTDSNAAWPATLQVSMPK
ncbi:HlyD family secretion protein [Lichenicola sp.]|uniref:HlyD family secretion protein n=1 Tax=Lichenicola sp. TaxID=2804529 RepID=UPI003AFFD84E